MGLKINKNIHIKYTNIKSCLSPLYKVLSYGHKHENVTMKIDHKNLNIILNVYVHIISRASYCENQNRHVILFEGITTLYIFKLINIFQSSEILW